MTAKSAGLPEFEALDLAFGAFAARQVEPKSRNACAFAARCASAALRMGEVSLELGLLAEFSAAANAAANSDDRCDDDELPTSAAAWHAELSSSGAICLVGSADTGEIPNTPLILTCDRLYIQRCYRTEISVAAALRTRAAALLEIPTERLNLNELLANYGGGDQNAGLNRQKFAIFNTYIRRFAVISGGPGTGKTTVAAALLALELRRRPRLRASAAAFTGKGAAQLARSLRGNADRLNIDDAICERLRKIEPLTIHALLEADRNGMFRRNADHLLDCDLLLIDEASMVSLSLFAKVLAALKPDAKLVLLGDHAQLNSIDPGRVLADICCAAGDAPSAEAVEAFRRQGETPPIETAPNTGTSPLAGCVVKLCYNYRSSQAPDLSACSEKIRNCSDPAALAAELCRTDTPDLKVLPPPEQYRAALLKRFAKLAQLRELADDGSEAALQTALALADSFKVLAALNAGPFGVDQLNRLAIDALGIDSASAPGVPVLLLANRRSDGLSNGDTGIWWRDPEHPDETVACFADGRRFAAGELPDHQPAFAFTVHKAQGAGFKEVLVILPPGALPLVGRELLYTGITRAELGVELWATEATLRHALENFTAAASPLAKRLAAPGTP